jgi:hypothetical protein
MGLPRKTVRPILFYNEHYWEAEKLARPVCRGLFCCEVCFNFVFQGRTLESLFNPLYLGTVQVLSVLTLC